MTTCCTFTCAPLLFLHCSVCHKPSQDTTRHKPLYMDISVKSIPQDSSATAPQPAAKPAVLPDPVYEFSAPRFYDFATNSQELPSSERADAWFDTAGTACEIQKYTACYVLHYTFAHFGPVCSTALTSPPTQSPTKRPAQGKAAAKATLAEASQGVDMVWHLLSGVPHILLMHGRGNVAAFHHLFP